MEKRILRKRPLADRLFRGIIDDMDRKIEEIDPELECRDHVWSLGAKTVRESKTYAAYKLNCDLKGIPEIGRCLFGIMKEIEKIDIDMRTAYAD